MIGENAKNYALSMEVEALYTAYCECLDEGDIEGWPSFFVNECLYRITTRENINHNSHMPLSFVFCDGQAILHDRAAALRRTVFYRNRYQRRMISGLRLKTLEEPVQTQEIETCASFVIFESMGDNPTHLLVCGRSTDIIVWEKNVLRFKQRLCMIDARIMPDSLVFPI